MNDDDDQETPPGLAPRVVVSIIVFFGFLIFSIIFVSFYAVSYSLFQKIAVILVAILAATAVLGAMWASWGINMEQKWKGCK